jgi:hypothetical protein
VNEYPVLDETPQADTYPSPGVLGAMMLKLKERAQ